MELSQRPDTPWSLFNNWFARAEQSEVGNPEAMSLATVGQDGLPQLRTVLLKHIDQQGLLFFTNSQSIKGRDITQQPQVSLLFYWRSLDQQIRINGVAAPIEGSEADQYFKTRNVMSQVGAWASQQSQPMQGPEELLAAVEAVKKRFSGQDIPRPPHWWGYRVVPHRFEFWIQETGRLHQRVEYTREDTLQDEWQQSWLYP